MLRILEIRTKTLNDPEPVELGPGCRVRAIKLRVIPDGGTAKLQFEDKAMTVLQAEIQTEWGGLNDPLPTHTRVTNGVLQILYDDGVRPK